MRHSESLNFPEADNERRTPRERVNYPASFRELGSTLVQVKMVDLTSIGCRVRGCETKRGEEIWLRIGNLPPMRAHVVWARGGEAGCTFYQPIPAHLLKALRQSA